MFFISYLDSNSSFPMNASKSFDNIEKSSYGMQTLPLHDKTTSPRNIQNYKIGNLIPCTSTNQKGTYGSSK